MRRLLNLLTVFAALLNHSNGCGLRARGTTGQRLLNVGATLVARRIGAGTGLESMSTSVGGSSSASLLSGFADIGGGSLVGGIASGRTGVGSSGSISGLGALSQRFRGGAGGSLLVGLGALAAERLRSRGFTGGSGPVATIPVSGIQQVQGVTQGVTQTLGGAVLLAGSAVGNSATRLAAHSVGSTALNLQSSGATQSGGLLIGGSGLVPARVVSGVNQGQGLVQSVQQISQTVNGAVVSTGGTPGTSPTLIAVPTGGSNNVPPQASSASHGGGVRIVPNGVFSSRAASGIANGIRQVQMVGQSVQPAAQPVGAAVMGYAGETRNAELGMGALPGVRPGLNYQGAGASQPGGALVGTGRLNPSEAGSGNNLGQGLTPGLQQIGQVTSQTHLLAVGTRSTFGTGLGPQTGRNPAGALMPGRESFGGGGTSTGMIGSAPNGGSSTVSSVPGGHTGSNSLPGLVQGPSEINEGFGARVTGTGSANQQSAAGMGLQVAGSTTQTFLGVSSRFRGGASGPGPNGSGSAPGLLQDANIGRGLGQRISQIGKVEGGSISGNAATILQSTASSAQNLQGVTSSVRGASPGSAVPSGRIRPSPGASNQAPGLLQDANIVRGLGQRLTQIGQVEGGSVNGNAATILQSTAGSAQNLQGVTSSVSAGFPGSGIPSGGTEPSPSASNPGWNPGQGAQPTSQTTGGGSFLSVSSSSQSSSSYHAHVVRTSGTSSLGGHPTSPGGGIFGSGIPSGGSGSLLPGTNTGAGLLGAIITGGAGGAPQGVPGAVGAGGLSVHGSTSSSRSVSSGVVSGITQRGQLRQRKRMDGATAAAISLGAVAGALTLGALGAGLAGAMQSGGLGEGGRRHIGCGGGGCSSGCGRKRRSVLPSKVPAEVLKNIRVDFDRLY